ncbi:MAG: fumarylacetoacetase [Candidatus Sericytochromatia bacterium]|nr:MAG: fumarylacetoacetase [Candidatus Sericytochromatia bacterium]
MKFVTFLNNENKQKLGVLYNNNVIDLNKSGKLLNYNFPEDIIYFLNNSEKLLEQAKEFLKKIDEEMFEKEYKLISPIPKPTSCRDGYAFRQHVMTARRNRGLEMIPEFDQFPVFYFTNHNSIFGEGEIILEEDHFKNLDFELEYAAIIGKKGKNIQYDKADEYIFGYTIMNDLSARVLQMEEMKLNLGPAKGKDFATILGPYIVTKDELEQYKINTEFGLKYDLEMKAYHNGKQISYGNTKDMNWTFAEIIERVSYGVEIYPGDVIGSGTVGTGCYLELNGTWAIEAKEKGESFTPIWLKENDVIELEITALGKLKNTFVKNPNTYSLLSRKKNV